MTCCFRLKMKKKKTKSLGEESSQHLAQGEVREIGEEEGWQAYTINTGKGSYICVRLIGAN